MEQALPTNPSTTATEKQDVQNAENNSPPPKTNATNTPGSKNYVVIAGVGIGIFLVIVICVIALANLGRKNNTSQAAITPTQSMSTPTPIPTIIPTPTPDPTEFWSVYIDDTNDFSINYPPPWVQNAQGVADPATGQTQVAITVVNQDQQAALSNFTSNNTAADQTANIQTETETIQGQVISETTLTLYQKAQNGSLVEVNKLYAIFIPLINNNTLEVYSDISKKQILNQMAQTFTEFPQVVTSNMTTWQKYTTSTGFYQFEYPPDYSLQASYKTIAGSSDQNQNPNFVQLLSPTIIQNEFQISIFYQPNDDNYTLSQAVDNLKSCPSISSSNARQIAFAGVQAYYYPDMPCGVNPITYIYMLNNNMFYTITVSSAVPYEQIEQSVAPILNTFAFN